MYSFVIYVDVNYGDGIFNGWNMCYEGVLFGVGGRYFGNFEMVIIKVMLKE